MGSGGSQEAFQLDALREVANIGAAHAATALSQIMTERRVMISLPDVRLVRSEAFQQLFGDPDDVTVAVWMRILGDLPGRTLLAMPEQNAHLLCDFMLERAPGTTATWDRMEYDTMAEAGNILGSAYLNALSDFLDIMVLPSVPTLVIDKPEAVAVQLEIDPEQLVLCAATTFTFPDGDLEQTLGGHFLHIPETSSLKTFFEAIAAH